MPFGKSLFNPGLFWKNVKRFWPIWGLYLLFWGIILPARILAERHITNTLAFYSYDFLGTLQGVGLAMSFCFGPLCAMVVFSYLYKARAANLIHALPIRREGLFLTNFLSGLSFLLVPNVLIFVLTLATAAARGYGYLPVAWTWLLVQCLTCLFFYGFAVFCAMFTGSLAALPIFYGILNFVFPALYMLVGQLLQQFLYGFVSWADDGLITALWPVVRMSYDFGTWAANGTVLFRGLATALLYGLCGLVFAVCALFIYRRRHIERAGDVVSVSLMRPVFKYGVAFCCALVLGTALSAWLLDGLGTVWSLTACILFCGVLGYFAAEMLLRKSFRVMRQWRGCAVFAACLLLCCVTMELDLTGFERRVPTGAASVEISGVSSMPYDSARYWGHVLTDPGAIEAARALHTAIVREAVAGWPQAAYPYLVTSQKYPQAQTQTTARVSLTYTLAAGGPVRRRYTDLPVTDALLADPDSAAAKLEALINRPELNGSQALPSADPTSARLTANYNREEFTLSTHQAREVYAAIRQDFAAGRLGRRFLLENQEYLETCYTSDLIFVFRGAAPQNAQGVPQPAYDYYSGGTNAQQYSVQITLQTTATSTIAALIRLGIISSADDLVTFAEEYAMYRY